MSVLKGNICVGSERGPEREPKHWTPDKWHYLIFSLHPASVWSIPTNIFCDSTWIHFWRYLLSENYSRRQDGQDRTIFCSFKLTQFPSVIPDALKSQAPLHTLLLHPRGMAQSSWHPRLVYRVKDKIEEPSQCRHQYQTRKFSAVSPLPCHFHYEKNLVGLTWDSHFMVQQQ